MPLVYKDIKDHVLGTKMDSLIEVLRIFERNNPEGLIGERELRRVLNEYLEHASDFHITTLICSLRHVKPPDNSNLFQRFKLAEVIEQLKQMKKSGSDLI